MAIFSSNLARLMREKIFTDIGLSNAGQAYSAGTQKTVSFYSGNQPTANDAVAAWGSTYNSNSPSFLAHGDITFLETSTSSYTISGITNMLATRSGTATFAVIYDGNSITSSTVSTSSGIASVTGIMVVPVSDVNTTTGIFKLLNVNLVAGSIFTVTDFTLSFFNI